MFYYLIGLGSNIQPQKHLIKAIQHLDTQVKILYQSPVLINPPCGDSFHYEFHNQLLLVESTHSKASLKNEFENIELKLGREKKTPARKFNDRSIDIDILTQSNNIQALFKMSLEDPYNQKILTLWTEIQDLL